MQSARDPVRTLPRFASGPRPMPAGIGRLQGVGKLVSGGLFRAWFRLEVRGAERMPPAGPLVLCMNHESMLDIPLSVVASPRPIRFMGKREVFRHPFIGRLLHELGGFPVDRERFDRRAIEVALGLLQRGEVVGIYPEGTRRPGELLPFLPGAAWLALRAGAPLLPASIVGTEGAMPRGSIVPRRVRVRVSFGEPIPVDRVASSKDRRAQSRVLTARVRSEIEALTGRAQERLRGGG